MKSDGTAVLKNFKSAWCNAQKAVGGRCRKRMTEQRLYAAFAGLRLTGMKRLRTNRLTPVRLERHGRCVDPPCSGAYRGERPADRFGKVCCIEIVRNIFLLLKHILNLKYAGRPGHGSFLLGKKKRRQDHPTAILIRSDCSTTQSFHTDSCTVRPPHLFYLLQFLPLSVESLELFFERF